MLQEDVATKSGRERPTTEEAVSGPASAGANVHGHLDGIHGGRASGWLWDPKFPNHALRFEVLANGEVVAGGIADEYRADLAKAGIGNGWHAFSVPVPSHVTDAEVQIRVLAQGHQNLENDGNVLQHRSQRSASGSFSVTYYPDYTATNPYQFLLAASLPDEFLASPGTIEDALEAALEDQSGFSGQRVFHLHWTTPIIAPAANEWDAIRRKELFLAKLRSFIGLGGLVIWTVHNTLSHDRKFTEVERDLCAQVARLASYIHVHSQAVVDAVRDEYLLPADKVKVIPHPNYVGVYPNEMSQTEARERLGIPLGRFVYAFIGQLRPYKGIQELLDAYAIVAAENPDSHLLIAGRPVAPYDADTVSKLASSLQNVTVVEHHIPDDELQCYFNASDVVVLPYKDVLTSGSVLNALSFGRTVIAPSLGMIPEVVEEGINGFLYDPGKGDALAAAMQRALGSRAEIAALGEKAVDSVRENTWDKFGRAIAKGIEDAARTHHIELDVGGAARAITASRRPGMHGAQARVAIIIVAYKNLDDVERLIASIEAATFRDVEIFLIDNGSPQDISLHELMTFKPASGISFTCIKTHQNLGYAGGNNIGVAFCQAQEFDYVWILNPDMEVSPQALDHLLQAAENHPEAGVFGGAIFYGADKRKIQSAGGRLNFSLGLDASHRYNGQTKGALPQFPYPADYITGASLFCRSSVFSGGNYIPEEYFLYFEETHWCQELRRQGIGLLVVPTAELYHHKRSEAGGLPEPYYFYYYIRNALLFTERFQPQALRATHLRLRQNFLEPWLKKIRQRAPDKVSYFESLAERAIQHAEEHVYGKQQIDFLNEASSSARKRRFDGALDGVTNGQFVGWLFDREANSEATDAHVEVDGAVAAVMPAHDFRSDLRDYGYGDGNHAFSIPLPEACCDGRAHRVVIKASDGTEIGSRRFAALPAATAKGRIDGVNGYCLEGWAYNPTYTREKVAIEVLADDTVVGVGLADVYRDDLALAGIGRGYHGFSIRLPLHVLDGEEREFTIRSGADGTTLFKRRLLAKKPVADLPGGTLRQQQQWMYLNRECRHNEDSALFRYFSSVAATLSARYREWPQEALISVVMPAFNREETIERSIVSVLAQTYSNFELIIVDDGSTDSTIQIVQQLVEQTADRRIRLVPLPANQGVSAARNAGLSVSQGTVIAYLDSDNEWREDYLLIMANALKESGASSAYCGQSVWHVASGLEEPVMVRAGEFWLALIENRNYVDLNCFIHTREVYDDCGGFNVDMRRLVDWELIVRYARHDAPCYVPVVLSRYFMARAQNQITQVEAYDENLKKMQAVLSCGERVKGAGGPIEPDFPLKIVVPVTELSGAECLMKFLACTPLLFCRGGIEIFAGPECYEHVRSAASELRNEVKVNEVGAGGQIWNAISNVMALQDAENVDAVALMSPHAMPTVAAVSHMMDVLRKHHDVGAVIGQELVWSKKKCDFNISPYVSNALPIDASFNPVQKFFLSYSRQVYMADAFSSVFTLFRANIAAGLAHSFPQPENFEQFAGALHAVSQICGYSIAKTERARIPVSSQSGAW